MLEFCTYLAIPAFIISIIQLFFKPFYYKKNVVEFQEIESYTLFSDDIKSLGLIIKSENNVIEDNVILIKANIRNNSDKDVDSRDINEPFSISTNSNYEFLKVVSIEAKPNTDLTIESTNKVTIKWDLFKAGEVIKLQLLVRPVGVLGEEAVNRFIKGLKFTGRIKDIEEAIICKDKNERIARAFFKATFVTYIIFACFYLSIYHLEFPFKPYVSKQDYVYALKTKSDSIIQVFIDKPTLTNKLKISRVDDVNNSQDYEIEEFNRVYSSIAVCDIVTKKNTIKEWVKLFVSPLLILILLYLAMISSRKTHNKK